MYVFIRSCIALTRGVVKIIQTDPDSFFSSRSGTLSSTAAAPTYTTSPLLLPLLLLRPLFLPFFFLFLSSSTSRRSPSSSSSPVSIPRPPRVVLSSPLSRCRIRDRARWPPCLYVLATRIERFADGASLMITGYNRDEELEEDACQSL